MSSFYETTDQEISGLLSSKNAVRTDAKSKTTSDVKLLTKYHAEVWGNRWRICEILNIFNALICSYMKKVLPV